MRRGRWLLPIAAVCAVAVVLAINLSAGGADYGADKPVDPCVVRDSSEIPPQIDAVAQRVVLAGVDAAACYLGVTRERLLLALATPAGQDELIEDLGTTRPELVATLKRGIKSAIAQLDRDGDLPKASAMIPDIVDELDLGTLGGLAGQLPDDIVDGALPTGDVLGRAADKIDYELLLANLRDPEQLQTQLRDAIKQSAIDEAREQISDRLGGLSDLF